MERAATVGTSFRTPEAGRVEIDGEGRSERGNLRANAVPCCPKRFGPRICLSHSAAKLMNIHGVSFSFIRSVVLACLLAGSCTLGAMAQPTVSVRGNVGASFFQSPDVLSEMLHSGVDLGLETGVRVYRGLEITVHGGYDQFTLNEQTARLYAGPIFVGDYEFLSGSLGLRYTYVNDSDAHPYVSTGVGIYRLTSANRKKFEEGDFVEPQPQLSATDWGMHLAIGALFRLDERYAVFFEPRYIFYDPSQGLGSSLRYFTLRLGVDVQF